MESGPKLAASMADVAFGHMTCTSDFASIFSGTNPPAPEARRRTTMNQQIANKAGGKFRAGARVVLGHHPIGTGFGSTIAGALVVVGAGAAGASAVVIYVSVATGIVLGGWAGHAISKRRSHRLDADVLRRRSHTLRLLRVTRVLRRRNVA
jgi:hypothetical protein